MLKKKFRDLAKCLTSRGHGPQPKPRRRGERMIQKFKLAATKLVQHCIRLPAAAYEVATFLPETLDWLNPWHHETGSTSEMNEDFEHTEPTNDISPRP
jgi:hypothetical protein